MSFKSRVTEAMTEALRKYRAYQRRKKSQASSSPRAIDAASKILARKKRMQQEMNP